MLKYCAACLTVGMGFYLVYGVAFSSPARSDTGTYPIVDTGQRRFYDDAAEIAGPAAGTRFYGQDAAYHGLAPSYRDNGDGTITDLSTGLMWQKDPGDKVVWEAAKLGATSCTLGGHTDWRVPTIKELYSLVQFSGTDPNLHEEARSQTLIPFIDAQTFVFHYGDPLRNERVIDAQFWSSTEYVSTTMNGNRTAFGVNFADGRIKGYPISNAGPPGLRHMMTAYVRFVRGNPHYGENHFEDNGDGTISDYATGLMWTQFDSGRGMNWEDALYYAETLEYAGYSDWRLPNAKELQSIVDYSRSPLTHGTAAINPLFETTPITNEAGNMDFPYFWTSTTHVSATGAAHFAVYVAFGTAGGVMQMPPRSGNFQYLDVHGAGAQRCDLKTGDPATVPMGRGPQGDVMRILNFVRCVRNIE